MFGSKEFQEIAKRTVFEMVQEGLDPTDNVSITIDDVYVVWFGYILGNMKAIISTNLPDGKYYEVTYDKDEKRIFADCYTRLKQKIVYI